jgi:lipopolysaccharide export system protein LptC
MKPSEVVQKFRLRDIDVRRSRRYSAFVGWMKFLLPVAAVVLVAMIVWWPRLEATPGFRFSFSDLERDEGGTLGVTKARFAGTDSNQRPFVVTAERAVQKEGFDVFDLITLQADITTDNGTWISVTADRGEFSRSARMLRLNGGVDVFTNAGYELHAAEAVIDLNAGVMRTPTAIEGHGPLGMLQADTLTYTSGNKTLNLAGRVRVTINPRQNG